MFVIYIVIYILGQYIGCGNTYTVDTWSANIDPIQPEIVQPWYVRSLPEMTWTYTEGEYYTLLVQDVGYTFNHGLYTNIQGNDIASSDVSPCFNLKLTFLSLNMHIFFL